MSHARPVEFQQGISKVARIYELSIDWQHKHERSTIDKRLFGRRYLATKPLISSW